MPEGVAREREIRSAVGVEVAGRERARVQPGRERDRWCKPAIPAVEQHADPARPVGDGEVGIPISVEVTLTPVAMATAMSSVPSPSRSVVLTALGADFVG